MSHDADSKLAGIPFLIEFNTLTQVSRWCELMNDLAVGRFGFGLSCLTARPHS